MLTISDLRRCPAGKLPLRLVPSLAWRAALALCFLMASQTPMQAVPAFARKYHLPCEQCHSMVPRLNAFGYSFYRAGYRLPGPNKPVSLANNADLLTYITGAHTNPGHSDTVTDDTAMFRFSGAVSASLSVNAIYNLALDHNETSGFDELWVQYNSAAKGTFWSLRVGQMPVLDGYNLLGNRQVSLTDPQLLGPFGALTGNNGNLNLSDLERGIEVGYTSGRFNTRLSLLYGIDAAGDANPQPRFNDYLVQAEYFLDKDGSAIQAFGYLGRTPIDGSGFANNFQRAGLLGTWGHTLKPGKSGIPAIRLELNGGFIWGEDQVDAAGDRQNSVGTVLEATLYLHSRTALFARYDGVHLGTGSGASTTDAGTTGISHRFTRFLTGELELREQRTPYNATILGTVGLYF